MWPLSVPTRISRPSALQLRTFPPSVVSDQVCRRAGKVVTDTSSRPVSDEVNATNWVSGEKTPSLLESTKGESVLVFADQTCKFSLLDCSKALWSTSRYS